LVFSSVGLYWWFEDGYFDTVYGGMEAVELIWLYEMPKGLTPRHIIALTANAMIGDGKQYLQA